MTKRDFAIEVVQRLRQAGFIAYWAGGCVRDELLGQTPDDYDVATDARPQVVQDLFSHTVAVGAAFGVIQVLGPRRQGEPSLYVEVATFRSDGAYIDGRRPEEVVFSSPEMDAQRRDFTINGMFFDPIENKLIDFVGGRADLDARVLRAIGDPTERFREDKLRMLRAVRFAPRFDLQVEPRTAAAIRAMASQIGVVSAERIAAELRKMLVHSGRAVAMRTMDELGLLAPVLPELEEMKGLPQGPPAAPTGDLWQHVLAVLERLEGPTWPSRAPVSFPLAFAALLHDVGKRRTVGRTPEKYTFHGHEHIGRAMASKICHRLKLSNEERERVEWLVEKHQYLCDAPSMRISKLKRVLADPDIGELLALHRADSLAAGRSLAHIDFCEEKLREWPADVLNPLPLLTGDDLIASGLQPGKQFKELLEAVREGQLEGKVRTKEEGVSFVRRLLSGHDT